MIMMAMIVNRLMVNILFYLAQQLTITFRLFRDNCFTIIQVELKIDFLSYYPMKPRHPKTRTKRKIMFFTAAFILFFNTTIVFIRRSLDNTETERCCEQN